jgi:4-hydroxyproline epimerase
MALTTFKCIDAHTCGNPVRVVVEGGPDLQGNSMFEKRQHFLDEYDWIRKGLMFEPRGHDMMSGSILYPPTDPTNEMGVLFIETSGCLPMCGHGMIGTVTVAIEHGLIKPKKEGELSLETPAGVVKITYNKVGNKVKSVKLINVPAYLAGEGLTVTSDYLGEIKFDVAYGGNFYAIVDPQENFKGIQDYDAEQLVIFSRNLRKLINESYKFVHPENPKINFVTHVLWTGTTLSGESHGRNAVFYGDKAIDRSPCGTGTSARMAQLAAKGKLKEGDIFRHESIIGSVFIGSVEKLVKVGSYDGIIPGVEGWAKITGFNTIFLDPEDDPYALGFQVI